MELTNGEWEEAYRESVDSFDYIHQLSHKAGYKLELLVETDGILADWLELDRKDKSDKKNAELAAQRAGDSLPPWTDLQRPELEDVVIYITLLPNFVTGEFRDLGGEPRCDGPKDMIRRLLNHGKTNNYKGIVLDTTYIEKAMEQYKLMPEIGHCFMILHNKYGRRLDVISPENSKICTLSEIYESFGLNIHSNPARALDHYKPKRETLKT